MDPTFWVALFACVSSIGVGIIQHFSAKASAEKVKEVHDFVNNKDKINTDTIAELSRKIEELQADILERADKAPARGSHSAVAAPVPVTIEGAKDPVPVIDKTPKK